MYLSKLEIFGFKSFAEKTAIEFDSGVSAIVGPNGSGKSNIVDALRWVLGEQGDKALRSEKREDVVFSGTSRRKPLGLAEVALTLINNKGILPTEYNEVTIARRFYRSGETEYFLNGTKVRLKDLRNLFVDTGVGPDAYSVIELKMVETILSAVKNERRKMFEEAAGIVSYKKNRDLTFNKLESVREALTRVTDIIREKQRNVNALERQVKRNEEARKVSQELEALELKLYNTEYRNKLIEKDNIKNNESENILLKERLSLEIKEYDTKIDELREVVSRYETKLRELNTQLTAKREEITKIEKENLVSDQKIKSLTANVSRLNSENESLRNSITRNKDRQTELHEKIHTLKHTVDISSASLSEKKEKLDKTIRLIGEKKVELKDLGSKLKVLSQSLHDMKTEYHKDKVNLENNLSELQRLSDNTSENLSQTNILSEDKTQLEAILLESKANLKAAQEELKLHTNKQSELADEIASFEREINERKLELNKKNSKVEYLTNLLHSMEDYAEGIKYLVKERKEQNIKTVIEMMQVEDKYRIAVETALGEVSNYLILDEAKDVSRLIQLLEENDKGKVTFILNEKLNFDDLLIGLYDEKPDFLSDKKVYGFADKFVKSSHDKYLLLIRYLLDEYVIVEDIPTAMKYSKDNYYKFITLNGDIITQSFIRAGGNIKQENLKLGREKQIDLLKDESKLLEDAIKETEDKINNLRELHDNMPIAEYKDNVEKLREKFHSAENDLAKVDFKLEEINKNLTKNEGNYQRIEEENIKLNSRINTLIQEINSKESENSNLEKELGFLTDEFNEIEKKYTEYNTDYNSFNIQVTELKNELKNEEQYLNRLVNSVRDDEEKIEDNERLIRDENSEIENLKYNLTNNSSVMSGLKMEEDSINDRYLKEREVFDNNKEELNRIDLEQRDRRIKFDRVSQNLIDSQIKMKECEIKAEQYRDHIREKYERHIPIEDGSVGFIDDEMELAQSRKDVESLIERLKRLGGGYQQMLFEDFEQEKEELQRMAEQKNDLIESEKDIRRTIERINEEARERFLKTFEQIRENFRMIFTELFSEGDEANLKLIYDTDDEGKINEDPLEAKIEIVAKPRGKRPTSIELLSGGEKTLTAIALLFAIYLVKPSPFCVLDEVDAPLDVANLKRFNKLIRKFSNNTQFILITHNERTMETVDRLFGVTMQEQGVTTIVETRFKEKMQAG
ncbi:MAG: chromosome segregation protein SMC [Ignavibacteriae bacterium]|nr:chromosome segregation protein SMC [Ignavibacteriota bacterium]